mgnify:CR=1 FL=1
MIYVLLASMVVGFIYGMWEYEDVLDAMGCSITFLCFALFICFVVYVGFFM